MRLKLLTAAAALALAAGSAHAQSLASQSQDFQPKAAGMWVVNLRVSDVSPSGNDAITKAGAPTGLNAKVGDYVIPTLGITYFFTDHIAAELILGASQHTVKASGPGTDVNVHSTWVLPPVLTAQYHFLPKERVSPYLGAGVGYMAFFSPHDEHGFTVGLPSGFGPAVQGGLDVALGGRWSANLDVKKVFFQTNANIDDGALRSKVHLDPWVFSGGVGYRF